ncbi:hypothetical protein Krac_10337 [Ktedonobacter racemifer DSM 44963]|uniref:Uncharacterized protein n=1 Tax=Ktedonobacter racemifer DSM 44963 TaxID=485913 RepID=D6TGQ6_KTERA|nr:hypothetical protein Krac_10337 [Ktedonobacter racemifer DSM 44963]
MPDPSGLFGRESKHEETVIGLPPGKRTARTPPEDLPPAIHRLGKELGKLSGEEDLLLGAKIVIVRWNCVENIIEGCYTT